MEQQDPGAFRAAVVSTDPAAVLPNTLVVPDHKLYFASFTSEEEAHYVCGFINSQPVRTWLGGFLLGKQIGTTVFEFMNVPLYDKSDEDCAAIAKISRAAHSSRAGSRNNGILDDKTEIDLSRYVQAACSRRNTKSS
ncbi:MAG: hypothetical protein AB1711_12140 [Thermodesulfobacteriota bacterium]